MAEGTRFEDAEAPYWRSFREWTLKVLSKTYTTEHRSALSAGRIYFETILNGYAFRIKFSGVIRSVLKNNYKFNKKYSLKHSLKNIQ